jgi:hypothetical protein
VLNVKLVEGFSRSNQMAVADRVEAGGVLVSERHEAFKVLDEGDAFVAELAVVDAESRRLWREGEPDCEEELHLFRILRAVLQL